MYGQKKGVDKMQKPPKIGRPLKNDTKRDKRLEIRLTDAEYNLIQETADALEQSRADTIVQAVEQLKESL